MLLVNQLRYLSTKVANTVNVIEKVTDTQLALLLLRQVNNDSSLTYTLRTSHSLSTKETVAELTRDAHTCLASLLRCVTNRTSRRQQTE